MTVIDAVSEAKRLLSSVPVEEGADPRWQAIIAVGDFIDSEPEAVWQFILDTADSDDEDLQAALATGLLEHLVEAHPSYKRRAVDLASEDVRISKLLSMCW